MGQSTSGAGGGAARGGGAPTTAQLLSAKSVSDMQDFLDTLGPGSVVRNDAGGGDIIAYTKWQTPTSEGWKRSWYSDGNLISEHPNIGQRDVALTLFNNIDRITAANLVGKQATKKRRS